MYKMYRVTYVPYAYAYFNFPAPGLPRAGIPMTDLDTDWGNSLPTGTRNPLPRRINW